MTDLLQSIIEEAWEWRDSLDTGDLALKRGGRGGHPPARFGRGAGRREGRRRMAGQPMAQEGRPAVASASTRWRRFRAVPAARPGGTRCRRNSSAGGRTASAKAGFRAVPGAIVRRGAYIAPGAVLMPSFVNIGAWVGEGTMVDTWATVGSCAQIGRNVHISGGAGIGGVLEPLQAGPVIIEDDCFIGARSEVAEGVIVEEGAVLSMGVFLGASTKIVDRATRRSHLRPRPRLFGRRARHAAERQGRPEPRLRRDRQAGRRADPLEDLDQRVAARLAPPALAARNSPRLAISQPYR